jgi:hypothetical protein
MILAVCRQLREQKGIELVGLFGGVLQYRTLTECAVRVRE